MGERQDVVVIGGGSGGFAAAMRAAQLGGVVTLIESREWGGNCMNRACIPSKLLMSAARLAAQVRAAGRLGLCVGEVRLDIARLRERRDVLLEGMRLGAQQLLADNGVRLVEGRGRLAGPGSVDVTRGVAGEPERIETRSAILASGSITAPWPVEGADLPGVIDSDRAVEVEDVPPHLAVLAAQPWDLELAQFYQAMGSQVTLLVPGAQLLPDADRDLAQRLGKLFHDAGMDLRRGAAVERICRASDGLEVILGQGQGEIVVNRVVAYRRLPATVGLGLRELGVRTEQGAVVVDERLATNVPGVYAVGDCAQGPMWSHKAAAQGVVAAENAMGRPSRISYGALPRCVYTWPEVAWVGLSEEQAAEQGIEVRAGAVPMAINPYASILDKTEGVIKVVAARRYGKVLGVQAMGPGAIELITAAALAIRAEATVGDLMSLIPVHPSVAEALVDAALDVEKRSLHVPRW